MIINNNNIQTTCVKLQGSSAFRESPYSNLPYEVIKKIFSELPPNKNVLLNCKPFLALEMDLFKDDIYKLSRLIDAIKNKNNVATIQHLLSKINCNQTLAMKLFCEALKEKDIRVINEMLK